MNALALLEKKITLLLERAQFLAMENEQYEQKTALLEKKVTDLQATLHQKEQSQTSQKDNKQADSIIDGLVQRIDSLLESPH